MPYFPSSGLKSFNTELVFLPRFVRHMEGICGLVSHSQAHACMFKYTVNTLGTLCRKHVSWGALFVWSVGLSAASIPATCPGQYSTHTTVYHSISQYTTVYHSTSQYIAVYHRIPQYITVYCSISQCHYEYIYAYWLASRQHMQEDKQPWSRRLWPSCDSFREGMDGKYV